MTADSRDGDDDERLCAEGVAAALTDMSLEDCSLASKDKLKKKRCDSCRKRVGLTGTLRLITLLTCSVFFV